MSTGRPPFRAETPLGIARKIDDADPKSIQEINSDLPSWLSTLILRLMTRSPDQRFQSASDVAELLEQCLAHVQQPTVSPLPESLSRQTWQQRWQTWLNVAGAVVICCELLLLIMMPKVVRLFEPASKPADHTTENVSEAAPSHEGTDRDPATAWNDDLESGIRQFRADFDEYERWAGVVETEMPTEPAEFPDSETSNAPL